MCNCNYYCNIDRMICPISMELCIYSHEYNNNNSIVGVKNGCVIIELNHCCKECYLCIIPFTCLLDLMLCPFTIYSNYKFYNDQNKVIGI